jgi:hypothetical protein
VNLNLSGKRVAATASAMAGICAVSLAGIQIYLGIHQWRLDKNYAPPSGPPPLPSPLIQVPKQKHRLPFTERQLAKKLKMGMSEAALRKQYGPPLEEYWKTMPSVGADGTNSYLAAVTYQCHDGCVMIHFGEKGLIGFGGNGWWTGEISPAMW